MGASYMYPEKDSDGWELATCTQRKVGVIDLDEWMLAPVKDSDGWELSTCAQPNPRVKDSEGWVLATCIPPNP